MVALWDKEYSTPYRGTLMTCRIIHPSRNIEIRCRIDRPPVQRTRVGELIALKTMCTVMVQYVSLDQRVCSSVDAKQCTAVSLVVVNRENDRNESVSGRVRARRGPFSS